MPDGGNGDGGKPEVGVAATLPVSLYGEELPEGASVGPYIVDEMVGRGGFARVYRGHHLSDRSPVAIKVLHSKLAYSPTVFSRFQREAETTQGLDHPSIVRHLHWGQLPNGRPYMIMEWLEGETLGDLMERRGRMEISEALPLIKALCEPLSVIHEMGIVHRDLKPSNVLVVDEETPRLKLLDFGLVRLLDDDGSQRLTSTGAPIGTPGYMAPEQILGAEVDAAVDVYALGVILFEMLTGKLPFRAPTAVEVQEQHLRKMPPRVSEEIPVPGTVDELIRRCLDKDPRLRPQPVSRVHEELASSIANPNRSTNRFATGATAAFGVYVRGPAEPLAAALETILEAELVVAMEEDDELLCVLPPRPGNRDELAHVIALARALGTDPALTVRVHEADATVLSIVGMSQITGGALLEIERWPRAPRETGVFVSATLVESEADAEPVDGFADIRRLRTP